MKARAYFGADFLWFEPSGNTYICREEGRGIETKNPVLRILIRIRRIHMFLGLSVPDPLVRDPDPSIIKQK
jgi:hypothetical protein